MEEDFGDAISRFGQFNQPQSPMVAKSAMAESYVRKARRRISKGEELTEAAVYALAAADIFHELSRTNDELEAIRVAGEARFRQERHEEVADICDRGFRLAKESFSSRYEAIMLYNRSIALAELDRIGEAIDALTLVAEINSADQDFGSLARAELVKARYLAREFNYEEALEAINKAIEANEQTTDVNRAVQILNQKAEILVYLGRFAMAEQALNFARASAEISSDPSGAKGPNILLTQARIDCGLGKFDKALEQFDGLIRRARRDKQAVWALNAQIEKARCLNAKGEFANAAALLLQCARAATTVKAEKDPIEIYVELACSFIGQDSDLDVIGILQDAYDLAKKRNKVEWTPFLKLQQALHYIKQSAFHTAIEILDELDPSFWSAEDESWFEYRLAKAEVSIELGIHDGLEQVFEEIASELVNQAVNEENDYVKKMLQLQAKFDRGNY
jgi:tetratricopeptide (TPR) repeat protein